MKKSALASTGTILLILISSGCRGRSVAVTSENPESTTSAIDVLGAESLCRQYADTHGYTVVTWGSAQLHVLPPSDGKITYFGTPNEGQWVAECSFARCRDSDCGVVESPSLEVALDASGVRVAEQLIDQP